MATPLCSPKYKDVSSDTPPPRQVLVVLKDRIGTCLSPLSNAEGDNRLIETKIHCGGLT
jgi:hypothetical protein